MGVYESKIIYYWASCDKCQDEYEDEYKNIESLKDSMKGDKWFIIEEINKSYCPSCIKRIKY